MQSRFLHFRIVFPGFLLLLLAGAAPRAFSQNTVTVKKDVVYLRNGSILVGEIEEIYPDSVAKIRIEGGSLFVFRWEEIDHITREDRNVSAPPTVARRRSSNAPRNLPPWRYLGKGYLNFTEALFIFGQNTWGQPNVSLGFHTQNNWAFRQWLTAGVGVGIDRYQSESSILPIYANVRGDILRNTPVTPYYSARAGWGFSWLAKSQFYDVYRGGLFYGFGFGVHFHSRYRTNYSLGLGYSSQRIHREYTLWNWDGPTDTYIREDVVFRRISFSLGMGF